MIKQLIKLATHLDSKGLRKEADYLDAVISKIAEDQEFRSAKAHSMRNPLIPVYYYDSSHGECEGTGNTCGLLQIFINGIVQNSEIVTNWTGKNVPNKDTFGLIG